MELCLASTRLLQWWGLLALVRQFTRDFDRREASRSVLVLRHVALPRLGWMAGSRAEPQLDVIWDVWAVLHIEVVQLKSEHVPRAFHETERGRMPAYLRRSIVCRRIGKTVRTATTPQSS